MLGSFYLLQNQIVKNPTGKTGDLWDHLAMAPPDPILGTAQAYKADKDPKKMNLGIGAYRDDNEKPYPFKVVQEVDDELASEKLDKEYLPIQGLDQFNALAQKLVFGADCQQIKDGKIVSMQSISGTGALRIAFEFIKKFMPTDVHVSNPTWANHNAIVQNLGLPLMQYPYYHPKTRGFDFEGMIDHLSKARPGSVIVLHACAHNPTGCDPTKDQWKVIAETMKKRNLFPMFDMAYQGFATGDLIEDVFSIRYFLDQGFQLIVTQSFAKNMGLYGERVGGVHFVCTTKDVAARLASQVKPIVRQMYSNPPLHGARIVAKILSDERRYKQWAEELKVVSQRIIDMRALLKENLIKFGCPGNWDHITNQIGMFSYTGLTAKQCECLINKWHIYLIKNGRISMAGITTKNVAYLAEAMTDAVKNC